MHTLKKSVIHQRHLFFNDVIMVNNIHTFAITSIPIFYGINFFDFAELLECISKVFFGILFITNNKQT